MATPKNTRNRSHQKTGYWGAVALGFVVGAFAMFLLHLKDNVPTDQQGKKPTAAKQKIEPTFDFYTLLPDMEVVVNAPKQAPIIISPPQAQPQPAETVSYMLQVGSFRKADDADSYRARLALLGVASKVQIVVIDNKDTWHRVQVGPIVGRERANQLQKQLEQNKIESLLMRAKHS